MNKHLPPFQKFGKYVINFKKDPGGKSELRRFFISLIIISVFLTIFIRLFQLTIVKGSYYRFIAENNRLREVKTEAPRGLILDRKGFTLAYSEKKSAKSSTFIRLYPAGEATAHYLGYRQLANKDDLKDDSCRQKLELNDKVGKSGVEKLYECSLRGIKGKMLIEVDAQGKKQRLLSETKPIQGKTVQLALDLELQNKTHQVLTTQVIKNSGGIYDLKEKKAAVVAVKPQSGEVLLMLSTPGFNPAHFEQNDQAAITSYFSDKSEPLFNRVLEGTYPPGSVFKLAVAAGALQEGKVDETFTVEDTGIIKAGPITFGNWYFLHYGKTEGTVNIIKGIRRSNDIFFYKVGEKLGATYIKKWADNFGFGKKTGIPLPEKTGLVPSDFWKREVIKDRWFLGDTYNLSIGQGYLLVTPMQINQMTTVFANNGKLCKPKLLKNEASDCQSLNLDSKTIELIREGMKQACSAGGTGWPFFDFSPPVGCKTGTAESHLPSGLPHSWFTVMAPFDNPEIVLTVMVEESGEGSNVAAPIAKEILLNYFERVE